jgi:Ca-activated chloride channel family protein
MRRPFGVFIALILLASAGVAVPQQPSQQGQQGQQQTPPPVTEPPAAAQKQGDNVQRVQVSEVDMVLAVVNHKKKFVTDLEKTDFRILEDNRPQEIKFFSRQTDLPLRVALLLDTSNSIRPRLQFEQDAAIDFLYNVVRPNRDLAFLMTFDSQPQVVQPYSNDLEKLHTVISAQRAGGGTALYDAMVSASELLTNAPLPATGSPEVRRVLVVISDGDDNLSSHSRADAIEAAQRAGVVVYAISTSTQWIVPEDTKDAGQLIDRKWAKTDADKILEQFAFETGGFAFFPYHVDDVAQSFMDIGTELRNQYLLGYVPVNTAADGRFRKIKIEIVGHKELDVRTRKGYFAVPVPTNTRPATNPGGN